MAEIDTSAPFASVRDAIYMFGEQSAEKTQHAFFSAHNLQLEKIHSLELELHHLREEHADTIKELLFAKTTSSNVIKELDKIKNELMGKNKKDIDIISSKEFVLKSQLDTLCEQEKQRLHELECRREEVENLHNKLKYLDFQHQTTLETLNCTEEEKKKLEDEINKLTYKYENHCKEQENIVEEKMKDLLGDLFATKEMLANANIASTVEIDKMKNKLLDAEDKQKEILSIVEKLKDELMAAKEIEGQSLQAEIDANLTLKRMEVEIEECKVAKKEVKMLVIELEDINSSLKNSTRKETNILESLASVKFELRNTNNELHNLKIEAKQTTLEMKEHIYQLQVDLNVAIMEEVKAKECLSNINEALQQVTVEAIEAKATATQAIEEVLVKTQELQEALLHNNTLECQLTTTMKEIEATKASEVFAHTEVKLLKMKFKNNIDTNENRQEVTISYDEYKIMAKQIVDSEDLAKKRIAVALAQVDASKASELEISIKLESLKKLLEKSQMAMKQAICVAENAEAAKSAVEEELWKWRAENEQRRKAAIAAVMAVRNNGVVKNCSLLATGTNSFDEKTKFTNESNGRPISASLNTLKPKQTLAPILRYKFFGDKKTKKKLFYGKISSYFNKKSNEKKLYK